jgi:UDP-N-acetylmuramoyl-tripeptide--D-alanyl-D-alanine ligase
MQGWGAQQVAAAAGAELVHARDGDGAGPARVVIDSRQAGPGDLFVGLPGTRVDGGRFAADVLRAGAWGVLVRPEHAPADPGAVLAAEEPLAALGRLARAWRRALGAEVVGITGSTGKTSTKDILLGLLRPHRATHASPANHNTEIGLPLAVLAAPPGTEVLVLELAMRGPGQIAELAGICEPDVGVIVNVGPVHLELLGSLEAIAAAKAELLAGLRPGSRAVVPAREPLLEPHRRPDLDTVTFGPGGDVHLLERDGERLRIALPGGQETTLEVAFTQAHHVQNLLAAVAAAGGVGVRPAGRVEVAFGALRGERVALPGDVTLVDDCYNANPMSMRAALADLAATAPGRRVAVLGDMLELGPDAPRFHAELGREAAAAGVALLVAVGPLAAGAVPAFPGEAHAVPDAPAAAALLRERLRPGDTVLVKGSRGVGLERVGQALAGAT